MHPAGDAVSLGSDHKHPNMEFGWLHLIPLLLSLSAPTLVAQTNALSLADSFPPAKLAEILVPRATWKPFPRSADRSFWEGLSREVRAGLIRRGEAAAVKPLPSLPATLYLAYAREGDRGKFEGPYFERRRRLHQLLLAELVEAKHRFRDAVADTLWAICEESTWCVPAHIGAQKAGTGLPDRDEPIVDLFAAQTGSSVAWTLYLYGEELATVSPRIGPRAASEVDRRLLTPYLGRDYGWMGFGSRNPANRPNNWNPWINGNILTAALLLEPDSARQVALVHRALRSLDRFLQPYPADGGCDEGPGYWSRAGGSVFDNLDLLHRATAGRLDFFETPLIREIGRFIHRVHIAGDWYVPIGDCSARTGIDRGVVYAYGKRIGDASMQALATSGATVEDLLDETAGIDLGRALQVVTDLPAILAASQASPPLVRDAWLGSDDLQMMIARDQAGSTRGLFLAAWGGHNAQSHNHNDVGNFLVFADGQPVLVDLGAPTYTAKTFSSRRYEIPAMQSDWHNLPSLNGTMQSAGRNFAAREVVYHADDAGAELRLELSSAWPATAQVKSWNRSVRLKRGVEIELTETFELATLAPGAVLHLLTPTAVQASATSPGELTFPLSVTPNGQGRQVKLLFDAGQLQVVIEPVTFDDARLAATWGTGLRRLLFSAKTPKREDRWTLRLRLSP